MKISFLRWAIERGEMDIRLAQLYGEEAVDEQRFRYIRALDEFAKRYGDGREDRSVALFSVSGRSEICGNHTDHNRGLVVGCAVDLDIIVVASYNSDGKIRVASEGFEPDEVSSENLAPGKYPRFSSASLIAGMCAGFMERGYAVGGFDAYTTSSVYKGSGLSSSAAFEVAVGTVLSHLYNEGNIDPVEIAKISQWSEREYFGKACGLMDQAVCAVGGLVAIDFEDESAPRIEKLDADISGMGYCMCITNTGGNHADLSDDYSAVPAEMKRVAQFFGAEVLRGLTASRLIENIPELRKYAGDRAILRALHFIDENDRVMRLREALSRGNIETFLDTVRESGRSSMNKLQNIYPCSAPDDQGISLALAISERYLHDKKAAWRVHGGGFAGTVQAFVPVEHADGYRKAMDAVFGDGACKIMRVRSLGATRLA